MTDASPGLRLQDQLCYAVYSAALAINRLYKPSLDELGLTYPQYLALLVLWEKDGLSVKEIADRLMLESSTLTPLLKRLEGSGFVTRRRSSADERQVTITLTEAGKALQKNAACVPLSMLVGSGRSVDELRRLNDEIRSLRDAIVESAEAA